MSFKILFGHLNITQFFCTNYFFKFTNRFSHWFDNNFVFLLWFEEMNFTSSNSKKSKFSLRESCVLICWCVVVGISKRYENENWTYARRQRWASSSRILCVPAAQYQAHGLRNVCIIAWLGCLRIGWMGVVVHLCIILYSDEYSFIHTRTLLRFIIGCAMQRYSIKNIYRKFI